MLRFKSVVVWALHIAHPSSLEGLAMSQGGSLRGRGSFHVTRYNDFHPLAQKLQDSVDDTSSHHLPSSAPD